MGMRRWTPVSLALSAVLALSPAAQAGRIIKANASGANASAPGHLGRAGAPVVVDSPLSMDAPSLMMDGGLPVVEGLRYDSDSQGLKARAYAREIQGRERPSAAAQFLRDDKTQDWLRTNAPKRHRELFKAAAGLNDLRLTLNTYEDPDTLRLALLARADMNQASSPQKMLAWIDADPSLARYRERVERAFWEWNTLTEHQHWALQRKNVTREQWERSSFDTRRRVLRSVGQWVMRGTGIGTVPKNDRQLEMQKRALNLAWGAFSNDERFEMNQRYRKGMTAFERIREAETKLAPRLSPTLTGVLEKAKETSDPEQALHWLGVLFDGVGDKARKHAVERVAEPRKEQRFTNTHRVALSLFMKKELIREIAGTQAGDMLIEFFKTNKLNLRIGDLGGSRFAQYDPVKNEIGISEKIILDYIRARDMDLAALFVNGEALSDLAALLAPSFVHEATHQTQFEELVDRGVPPSTAHWYDTTFEVEAFSRQSLFVHEKARTSERHRELYVRSQRFVDAMRSATHQAQQLRDDPAGFRNRVLGAYVQVRNLSGMAAKRLVENEASIRADREARRVIGAELSRRSRLPNAERQRRERDGIELREWSARGETPVDLIKTSTLRAAMRYRDEGQTWVYDLYRELRDRYANAIRGVMTRLEELYPGTNARVAPAPTRVAASSPEVERPKL
jgi:hypothetical protein